MLNEREHNSLLIDYYGDLLTNHQKEILNEYYNEDLSMNEIAENYEISKSAVQDLIKRSLVQLNNYEKILKLIEKDEKLNSIIDKMNNEENELVKKYADEIVKIR